MFDGMKLTESLSRRDDLLAMHLSHAFDFAKAQPNRRAINSPLCFSFHPFSPSPLLPFHPFFKRAIPLAVIDVNRAHFHSMLLRVSHNLRRLVKTHWLAIEQRRAKRGGFVALQPG